METEIPPWYDTKAKRPHPGFWTLALLVIFIIAIVGAGIWWVAGSYGRSQNRAADYQADCATDPKIIKYLADRPGDTVHFGTVGGMFAPPVCIVNHSDGSRTTFEWNPR